MKLIVSAVNGERLAIVETRSVDEHFVEFVAPGNQGDKRDNSQQNRLLSGIMSVQCDACFLIVAVRDKLEENIAHVVQSIRLLVVGDERFYKNRRIVQ